MADNKTDAGEKSPAASGQVRITFPKGYGARYGAPRDPAPITAPEGSYPPATLNEFAARGAKVERLPKSKE